MSLIGYSLPQADPVMMGMLESVLRSEDLVLDIVNPDPEDVMRRLMGLGASEGNINVVDGSDCVARFTGDYRDRAARELVTELAQFDADVIDNPPLLVAWTNPQAGGSGIAGSRTLARSTPMGQSSW